MPFTDEQGHLLKLLGEAITVLMDERSGSVEVEAARNQLRNSMKALVQTLNETMQ